VCQQWVRATGGFGVADDDGYDVDDGGDDGSDDLKSKRVQLSVQGLKDQAAAAEETVKTLKTMRQLQVMVVLLCKCGQ